MASAIGAKKLSDDIWDDRVILAARLGAWGDSGRFHAAADFIVLPPEFECDPRGAIDIKGFGRKEN